MPIWLAACTALLALQAVLIINHEPWLDEYQAVQIAVQAPDITTLLEWLRYEGHPPLWYLILRGLAHFMEPLTTLPAVALILAAITQCAILFASPFGKMERLLIAASQFVLFDFLTLSRSMNMGVALLVLALVLWRTRWSWLAIALLPMCDFLFGLLSGVLVLLKWREHRLSVAGVSLWLVVGLAAAWSVIPAPDMLPALEREGPVKAMVRWMTSMGTLAVPFQGGMIPRWNEPVFPIAFVAGLAFLWFAWRQTSKDCFHRFLLFSFIGLTFAFSIAIYPLALRHLMLIALLLILLVWLRRSAGEQPNNAFRLWLAVAAFCGIVTAGINMVMPFDTARLAAAEIKRLGLTGKHWMVFPDSRAQGVSALTGIQFERAERHCMQDFIRWNFRTTTLNPKSFATYLRLETERYGQFYLLSDLEMDALPGDLIRPIAKIAPGYNGQAFYLYEVGPGLAEKKPALPPCVAGRRPFSSL